MYMDRLSDQMINEILPQIRWEYDLYLTLYRLTNNVFKKIKYCFKMWKIGYRVMMMLYKELDDIELAMKVYFEEVIYKPIDES